MHTIPAEPAPPSLPFELRHASTDRLMLVVVPERRLFAIDGAGYRNGVDFRFATAVLHAIDESLRVMLRHDPFTGSPRSILEVRWATPPTTDLDELIAALDPAEPRGWRQMLEIPRNVSDEDALAAIERAAHAAGRNAPLARRIRFTEGRAAQLLHVGATGELDTIGRLLAELRAAGWQHAGDLHELVLADRDIVPAPRARSIFRIPIEAVPLA